MQKIKKNFSAIQQKFEALKQVYKNNEIPTKIGQVAEIMTYGVVSENQVNEYLQETKNKGEDIIDENWMDITIQSMILFFDKVIKHRNLKKPQEGAKKQRRKILSWQKIKTKMSNKEAHQNPFRPHRMGKQGNSQSSEGDFTNGTMNFGSDTNILSYIKQKADESYDSELQQQQFCQLMDAMNSEGQKSLKYKSKKNLQESLNSDLPADFGNYPLQEKFIFLRTNYDKKKNLLQKKFDMIYTHYKKEMYIRRQTFKKNEDLMLDLKTFLKYYREFQIAKKYKVVQATNNFKNLAINGLWLNDQNFYQLHYKLAQIILNSDEKEIQQRLKMQNQQKKNIKTPQQKQLKRLLIKTTKMIMQNMIKLKDLTQIVSDEKVKKLLNDNRGKAVVKRIVQVHSGLAKEDILQRLKQRIEQKKKKGDFLNRLKSSSLKLKTLSSQKVFLNKEQYSSIKANPSFRSIYRQLLLPNLTPSEMKNASVYSSLELLNIHKEKEKLRQLISEDDNQKYLQAFFKKEKILNSMFKSNKPITKTQYQTPKNSQFLLSNYKSIGSKSQRKQSNVKKSLSLPRMKFT